MLVSCLCVCHNKPDVTPEAIQSLLNQTYPNWEAIVVDSGVLYDAGYYDRFPWRTDRRIQLIRSHETAETRRTQAMAPWCFNECFRRGMVKGDLVMYLCDDDILYPNAFGTFVSYCRGHPEARAMYASQDIGVIYPNGWHAIVGERRATEPGGRSCHGRRMDCEVDYLQFCHRADILKLFPDDEFWPEAKETEEHADGLFMERVGAHVPIHPIDVKVSQNRRTPRSTYTPLPPLALLDCLTNGVPLLPGRGLNNSPIRNDQTADPAPLVTVSVACHDQVPTLPAVLEALAAQTYPRLEVLVIDGSIEAKSVAVFEELRDRYPHFRFLRQNCAGIAAKHNLGLKEAHGTYFIPMETSHLACPDMVERLVARVRANPRLSAVTCYLLTLNGAATVKNIHGPALFRTSDCLTVGGFDRAADLGQPDWSIFFKLVNAGRPVDILPEHLFWTQHPGGTDAGQLEPFFTLDRALTAERTALWETLAGLERRAEVLARENEALRVRLGLLRYRIVDRLDSLCSRVPLVRNTVKRLFQTVWDR
jgi:glycosyltransferase involved in cell wall biosynthesis